MDDDSNDALIDNPTSDSVICPSKKVDKPPSPVKTVSILGIPTTKALISEPSPIPLIDKEAVVPLVPITQVKN